MEEEKIEQLVAEPEQTETSESSMYGKFKDAQSLLDAYNSLQAEFTRKSQKLAEFQKKQEENAFFSNNESLENIVSEPADLEKYKKEVTEILESNKDISNLPNRNLVALTIAKEAERKTATNLNNPEFIDKLIETNEILKEKVISKYLSNLNQNQPAPKVISGNSSSIYFSPSLELPKTLKDAGEILTKMLK